MPFIPDWTERIITNSIVHGLIDTLVSILSDCDPWSEVDPIQCEHP